MMTVLKAAAVSVDVDNLGEAGSQVGVFTRISEGGDRELLLRRRRIRSKIR